MEDSEAGIAVTAAADGTVVLQSQREASLSAWQRRCCDGVKHWAEGHGFAYRFEGDELFERVPSDIRRRFASQPVVLSDLARLLWLREALDEGFGRAIWVDADVLLFRDFAPADGDRFGRECWIQRRDGRLRSYRKLHNAWLQFVRGSVVLPFYIDRALLLLSRARPPVVPQFLGPKLLTAWHNIAPFAVEARVGMLAPLPMAELLRAQGGDTPALRALVAGHEEPLCALNLCASFEGRREGDMVHGPGDFAAVIDVLLHADAKHRLDPGHSP
ncbi:MAG: hypothetical protein V2I82_16430 [Halieaceae bacterium]|jgi:hypothetical protein|nr:hypothetical protein [Halieaceae bacterium]